MTTEMEKERDRLRLKLHSEFKILDRSDAYFEGRQPLRFVAPTLERELGYRLSPIVINLAEFATDVYDNRLDIEGFRFTSDAIADKELGDIFIENDGDLLSQQAHRESLALGRSYAIVGAGEDRGDAPIITAESAFDAIHEDDPVTKAVRHGIKQWSDADGTRWVTYYHREGRNTWVSEKGKPWKEDAGLEVKHDWKLCSLVPLPHQGRMLGRTVRGVDQRLGRSVFANIVPVMDALNKISSDMMVSAEFHALPRRWATGLEETDFIDDDGNPIDVYSMIAGRMWGTTNKDAKFGQFAEADLQNFHNTIKLLTQVIAMQLGLPSHYLTFMGDNPPSADAIRSSEAQLVKRAERLQRAYGARWRQIMKLALLENGTAKADLAPIEVLWRDPSTPTIAQKADAIVKLVQAKDGNGRSLLPIQQAREDMGYTDEQQRRMLQYDADGDPQVTAALRALEATGGSAT
ncbi:phage portal protein [Herbiconiux sp. KACC 21604]|uniref:phage portal protein n=1 Tax=unclassified Herbiconiux TaxID=2618217 RepID=UPI0014923337|nr:phage portal protein [Herbiconiux sp. SALV-R1]QJU54345.1 phage portal protein [Herbiconiux sp. SALV-R1]WPO85415.1 phage portal protein [Herbiconiux sp. KACC 21604]